MCRSRGSTKKSPMWNVHIGLLNLGAGKPRDASVD
jgi:hypothetical protein